MSGPMVGIAALVLLMALIALRVPIAVALVVSGLVGYAGYEGATRAVAMLASIPAEMLRGYSLSVVPLFILMGAVAARAGLSSSLYEAARAMSHSRSRGGMASATVGACAMFGTICGSSIATVATMAPIALPEMQRSGYSDRLAAGAVAAGATVGILIPPSVILIVYALLVEESVPALFAAAMIPGLLLTLFCILVIKVLVFFRPGLAGPQTTTMTALERFRALAGTWKILLIFGVSLGGIYLGWFSPTEAAAVGAALALGVAASTGRLSVRALVDAIDETVRTTAMLFFVFMGALMFSRFIAMTRVPVSLAEAVTSWGMPSVVVIATIILIYIVLGCFLDTLAMILITAPVFLPVVQGIGYDAIWFGVLVVVVAEMGLITPPVGMNIFALRAQAPHIPFGEVVAGVFPFLSAHAALIVTLVAFPAVATWLPALLLR